jgi:hypothetical protein
MTLASVKKLAIQLPPAQGMKLAHALLDTIPPLRQPVTLDEMQESISQRRSAHRG